MRSSEGLKLYWLTFFSFFTIAWRQRGAHHMHTGVKNCEIWPQFSTLLSSTHFKMQQDSWNLKQLCEQRWWSYVLSKFGEVRSTYPWKLFGDLLQKFKVKRSKPQRSRLQRDITYQQQKCDKPGMDKLTEFKRGKNYPKAEHTTWYSWRSLNIEIAITPPQIVRFRPNLVQSLTTTLPILQMFKVKGKRLRSQRNVTYQQWKRYKTATDRLSDFTLGMNTVI